MIDLKTSYLGFTLKNPVIAASSGLTNSLEDIRELVHHGASAIVLKSIFEEEIRKELEKKQKSMVQESFIYPETLDFYDNYDVEDTLTRYLKLIHDCKKEFDVPVIASINCVTSDKWPYYAGTLQDAGADALELNVFVLPSDPGHHCETNEKLYFDIVEKVQKEISIPFSLKISSYSSNLASLVQRLSRTGISGMVLFNRFYSPDIDLDKLEVVSSHVYSQPSDMALSLRWIAIMAGRVDCDLAASTGIHDGRAVIKQILAGAAAVQVASTLYRNGKDQIARMLEEINTWMKEKGYHSLDEIRGKLSFSNVDNPAAYERVQFMKYFAGK